MAEQVEDWKKLEKESDLFFDLGWSGGFVAAMVVIEKEGVGFYNKNLRRRQIPPAVKRGRIVMEQWRKSALQRSKMM